MRAIEARIAVYSPHTSLDVVDGGINDWLAQGLGVLSDLRALRPLEPYSRAYRLLCRVNEKSRPAGSIAPLAGFTTTITSVPPFTEVTTVSLSLSVSPFLRLVCACIRPYTCATV